MPLINEMMDSKFLKKEDVGEGVLVVVLGVEKTNVAKDNEPEELKWVLHGVNGQTQQRLKPMVLNTTNLKLIAKALNSENTDEWNGKEIVLYNDVNVSFGDKVTGGIRVRAKREKPVTQVF